MKKAKLPIITTINGDLPQFQLKELTVRALNADEYARAGEHLDQEHYLGDLPKGRELLQVVEFKGVWVALLDWGPCAHKLAERDEWIGWTGQQRAERSALVVMNRRFLVLAKTRVPNLASRALSLATNALGEHWEQRYGFKPVLAETFSDIEAFEGTCYKAAGWMACGETKGFGKNREDYYVEHARPKKLWLKTLNRNTRVILTGMDMPKAYKAALNTESPERDLPLKRKQAESLQAYLRENFKDPRRNNRTFTASSLLVLIAMGLFAGRRNLNEIQRYGQLLTLEQRRWLNFPANKNGVGRKVPSYSALRNLLLLIDPHEFARVVSDWLQINVGTLPRALAIDGKWVRDKVLSICLSDHETGVPVVIDFANPCSKTDENKREGEHTVALRIYEKTDLTNATVTGDAGNCSKAQSRAVIKAGGDYVFQLKDENRHAHKYAQKATQCPPLFF